ncbi:hypothetical protein QBC45DRAFT_415081 [Copromyces sp. CBS 386.78]|nr:hypothetical protein QBC45DRAFT_415081 [Copromyces sp. CBS 386.78]
MLPDAGAGSRSFGVTALSRQTMGSTSRVHAYEPDKFTGSHPLSMPGRCKSQSGCEQICKLRFVGLTLCQVPSSRPVCPAYKQPKTNWWPKTSSPFIAPAHPVIPRSATGCGGVLRWSTCTPCLFSAGGGILLPDTRGQVANESKSLTRLR